MRRTVLALLLAAPLLIGAAPQGTPAPSAKAPSIAKGEGAKSDALRKRCYGGRDEVTADFVVSTFERSLMAAVAKENHERISHFSRRILRAGGEELVYVPLYLLKPEAAKEPLSEETIAACNELLDLLKRQAANEAD